MTPTPFFSVVIPAYNEEKYLPKLLCSLEKQTFYNFEVFVVDGQSKDKTRKVVASFQPKLPKLKLLTAAKRNVSYQRNLGSQKAKGDFLIFMDADIWFDKNVFGNIHHLLQNNKTDVFLSKGKFPDKNLIYKLINLGSFLIYSLTEKFQRNLGTGSFLGIEKNLFKQIKGFDQKLVLAEEHQLIKKARNAGAVIKFFSQIEIILSPRRLEKEGVLKFLLKYFYFCLYEHFVGPLDHLPLGYQMGGSHYD